MDHFEIVSPFKPAGDQPEAIRQLTEGAEGRSAAPGPSGCHGERQDLYRGQRDCPGEPAHVGHVPQQNFGRPALRRAESFFPHNAVEYFISYYDYYQPEAYVPQSDTYIEKDASINDHIDRLRLKATSSLLERRDVVVVASVSSIYGLGSPREYKEMCVSLERGASKLREDLLRELVDIQYERNEIAFARGKFRVKGDVVEIFPAYLETALRVELDGDRVARLREFDPLTGETLRKKNGPLSIPPNTS
jgi:excinuclease ABC subunit B